MINTVSGARLLDLSPALRSAALPLQLLVPDCRIAPAGAGRARRGAGLRRPRPDRRVLPGRCRAGPCCGQGLRPAPDRRQRVAACRGSAPGPAGDRPHRLRQSVPAHHPGPPPFPQGGLPAGGSGPRYRDRWLPGPLAGGGGGDTGPGPQTGRAPPRPALDRRDPAPLRRGPGPLDSPVPARGCLSPAPGGGGRGAHARGRASTPARHPHRRAPGDHPRGRRGGARPEPRGLPARAAPSWPASTRRSCWRRPSSIADACRFSLDELRYEYPDELVPAGEAARPLSAPPDPGGGRPALARRGAAAGAWT